MVALGFTSCSTSYDAYGRPVESIDPATAVVGALVIGAAAYAIGNNKERKRHHKHHGCHHGGYHHGGYHHGGCYHGGRY